VISGSLKTSILETK
jgi:hypothetical protein